MVVFEEGDQIIEMVVEGQESDFASEAESSNDEDNEITFNMSQSSSQISENNNASVLVPSQVDQDFSDEENSSLAEKGRSNPELTQRDGSVVEDAANKSQSALSLEEKQNIIGQAVGQAVAQV